MSEFDTQPQDGDPAPQETEGTTTIAIGGTTYRVPQGMADSINAERTAQPSPAAPVSAEAPPSVAGGVDVDSEEFWSDPQAYIQKQIQSGISTATQKIQHNQSAAKEESKFWEGFYVKNPHLKQIESYVNFIATQNVDQLKQFNGDKTKIANFIADLGNKEMQKFGRTPDTSEVFVEGTAQPTTVVNMPTQKRSQNVTMGDVLKKRREKRRVARLGA